MDRLDKQIDFVLEVDKVKNILRQTHITGYQRQENDAEHSWHMALMIYLLKEYANREFDVAKAMMMALIHDVVEIDAGDTYAYDPEMLKSKDEREQKAAERIFGMLPDDQQKEFYDLFYEFEKGETMEAKFVKAMDNFQPLLLNNYNNGNDWKRFNIKKSQVVKRQSTSRPGSEKIWQVTEKIIEQNTQKGNLIKD